MQAGDWPRNTDAASRMDGTTERLDPDAAGVARAADLLRAGRLVAFPTETVYGLGADARQGEAVAAIFEAKGRPRFNPLIVHVPDVREAERYGVFPAAARSLVAGGWPAGLTLVVPLREGTGLSPLVSAGNPTVALRLPKADLAQRLLRNFGGPLAGPSANPSGRVSPTTADHVLSGLSGRIAAVLDGGPTEAGLESTILGFPDGVPTVYREGVWQAPASMPRLTKAGEGRADAPGQFSSHYAPKGSVRLDAVTARPGEWHIGFGPVRGDVSLSPAGDLREAAAALFSLLHEADAAGRDRIAVAPIPDRGLGRAINDRLRRAAAPRQAFRL
ncbi:translation factor SUA5 [Silicimonas algicola]|uniref:Threonylcarbamoyl-AMP synthase n=2 Tax=Silicimonas algicola TaxID=1826607 RepID=A0A316GA53_9RHOB|nr:translation factor SUA5 [Silicimonas algicola]